MAKIVSPVPELQFIDADGVPYSGGKLYTYAAGTTTPQTTYTDYGGTEPNTNPVVLDSAGRAGVWLGSSRYKFRLTDANDVVIFTVDNLGGETTAADVTFTQSGTAPETQTVQNRMKESILITDYADGVGDGTTICNDAFANALNECATKGKSLYVPGTADFYKLTDEITVPAGVKIWGDGYGSCIKQTTSEKNCFIADDDCVFLDLNIQGPGTQTDPSAFTVNNGIFASNARNIRVEGCYVHGWNACGVQFRECFNVQVLGNLFHGNYYDFPTGVGSTSDVLVYSGTAGGRTVIANNLCLSDNSSGIYVNAIGYDNDITISANICVSLDSDWNETDSASLNRRAGIITSYGGGPSGGRVSVVGNVCRNTLVQGIYCAQGVAGGVAVTIVGNVCSRNGFTTTDDRTLSGGISCNGMMQSTVIANNTIYDFQGSAADSVGAITISPGPDGAQNQCDVVNNSVNVSAAYGIVIKGYPEGISIRGNRFYACADSDLSIAPFGGTSRIDIYDNTFWRTNTSHASLYIGTANFATIQPIRIISNRFVGHDKSVSGTTNCAVYFEHGSAQFELRDNVYENYGYGIYCIFGITGRNLLKYIIDTEHFYDTEVGIVMRGSDATALVPAFNCTFDNVTTSYDADGYYDCLVGAVRQGTNLIMQASAAGDMANGILEVSGTATTRGTLAVGDVLWNAAAASGGAAGWMCTTAGNPSTPMVIKAMANLA